MHIAKIMSSIDEKLDALSASLSGLNDRLSALEEERVSLEDSSAKQKVNKQNHATHGHVDPGQADVSKVNGAEAISQPRFEVSPTHHNDAVVSTADYLQEEFNAIKDTLGSVKLPADQKLCESRAGINRSEQPVLNIISKCGRYVETALKWVGIQEPRQVTQNDLLMLHTVLLANLRYLQSEYQSLLVTSNFDRETSRFFRTLQKDSSHFSDESLKNLRAAVEVASLRGRQRGSNFRGGYRGGYRGHNRGHNSRGHDQFHHFANRGVGRSPSAPQDGDST